MTDDILTQSNKTPFSLNFEENPVINNYLDESYRKQNQLLFQQAIKEHSLLILLASALMTNAIRTLSTFAPEIEGKVEDELQILSNNTVSSINRFFNITKLLLGERKKTTSEDCTSRKKVTAPLQIERTISSLLNRSGLRQWFKTIEFHARKEAIRSLAESYRSQIISSNIRFIEKIILQKGGEK